MKTLKLYSIGLVTVMIFTFSQQTFAQLVDFYTSPGYTTMIDNLMTNHIWNSSMQKYTKKKPGGSGVSKSTSSSQSSPPAVPDYRKYPVVQFKPTGTRLMVQEIADTWGKTPEKKAYWKKLISETLDKYEAFAVAKGYPNDLALAFVSLIGLSKHMYHGTTEEPNIPFDFQQNTGLRDIVAKYADDNGTFNKYTDREKQGLYELFVIYGSVSYHLYKKAIKENDAESLHDCKIIAVRNLEFAGIKP